MEEDNVKKSIARPELIQIAEAVARDKSIDQEIVIKSMEQAIQSVAKRKYGQELEIKAGINSRKEAPKNDDVIYSMSQILETTPFSRMHHNDLLDPDKVTGARKMSLVLEQYNKQFQVNVGK